MTTHSLNAPHSLVAHTYLSISSRMALRQGTESSPRDSEARIPLETLKEITWWARFTDEDFENQAPESIRTSTSLQEILLILGAGHGDAAAATLRLAPGLCATHQSRRGLSHSVLSSFLLLLTSQITNK